MSTGDPPARPPGSDEDLVAADDAVIGRAFRWSLAVIAVMGAALGVFGTGRNWPDLAVAAIMAGLAIWGSLEVFRQARGELAVEV